MPLGEQCVEPIVPIQLTVPPRLDDTVGVEDEGGPGRQVRLGLRVLLTAVDPEHEAVRFERPRRAVGEDDSR